MCLEKVWGPFTHKDVGGGGVSHLLTRMEVEKVWAIYSQGWRWRRCKTFTHKDGGGGGVRPLLTRMEVEEV